MRKAENSESSEDFGWVAKLVAVLETFRTVDPDITANQILALLLIAREPGISHLELSDKNHLNVTGSTATRLCAILSDRGNRGAPGKGLIEIGHAPGDYRATAQSLTAAGRELLARVRKEATA
ncbi:MAG: MarR family transcriptional regulator [Pseudolabrys sp.]|nr:MarR family transcriptional regulator [Pseudolabrys sp.]